MFLKFLIFLLFTCLVNSFDLNEKLVSDLVSSVPSKISQTNIPNIASRLSEPVLLECGTQEHELLKQLESNDPSMPVLVNWFKHYSLTRRSEKPFYAKYLANNIDYAPHISRDYENRIQVVNKINLNISSLKAVDEALYECRLILFDKAYADSQTGSMFYLQVQIAPEFEYPNEEIVYFKPNIPVRLYCYAKGKPTPTITWFKNGKKLEVNTSVLQETFSIYENSDIFEYRCKAENKVGLIEHTVKVIRSGSLFFTEPLKNLTVTEGTILNWPCLAQSNTEITYKWFKDSVSVQSHLHKWSDRGALFQDGMLYLLETYRNDSGFYECHAFTSNKRIETSAYLNVLYGPEILPFQSPFFAFENSQGIVIDCVVKSNPSIIALEWFKDQYLLSNTGKYEILPNNSLLIKNPTKSDEGNYYCSCNNTIKKTVSQVIKVEVIENKKFEKLSFSTSKNEIKLPCLNEIFGISPNSENVNWYKINSKLPQNRFSFDSNGSLVLHNLKTTDTGYYYCKLKNEFVRNKVGDEVLVKLSVMKNKTSSDSSEYQETNSDTTELPLCPQNVNLNQTKDGIKIKWSYPHRTPVKIEYFQIYFREINEKINFQLSKKSNQIQSSLNYEWKTTEPINPNVNSYLIDDSELELDQVYEIQLVSFSSFSKSIPTPIYKIKYKSTHDEDKDKILSSIFPRPTTTDRGLTFNNLNSFSQLDLILAAVFIILICVLIISITACVIFRQSNKNMKMEKKGDLDDWGFQSSSAATTTFLSSSSSDKSSSLDSFAHKNKLHRNPEAEFDLKNEQKFQNDDNDLERPKILSEQEDMFDDGDYYYSKPKIQTNTLKSRNCSYYSNSTTTGISSNPNSNSRCASTTSSTGSNNQKTCQEIMHSPNFTSGASSSGITSVSATSSLINSDDNNEDMSENVNTIKYNAKTNIIQTQGKCKKFKNGYKSGQKKSDHLLLDENYSKTLKSSRKQDVLNEYSGISLDVDSSHLDPKNQWSNENSSLESNYSSPNKICESKNNVAPFPTSHFKEKNRNFSYINPDGHGSLKLKKIALSSESTSSSSSGCSSLETQQVFTNHEVNKYFTLVNHKNHKNLVTNKKKNVNFVRNSICLDNMELKSKTLRPDKKELIYSTNYKPVIKSSLLNNNNNNNENLLSRESPKRSNQTSTFKQSKIDYV